EEPDPHGGRGEVDDGVRPFPPDPPRDVDAGSAADRRATTDVARCVQPGHPCPDPSPKADRPAHADRAAAPIWTKLLEHQTAVTERPVSAHVGQEGVDTARCGPYPAA